jgi:hypothetical protein
MLDLSPAPSFAAHALDRPPGRATHHGLSGRPTTSIETIARAVASCTKPRSGTYVPTGIMIRRRAEEGHVDELLGALDTLTTELDRPGLAVRFHVSTHRLSLDRELARGDSPLGSAALALRARQLVSPRTRERLAAALERLVECAKRRPAPSEIVWVPHREILEARSELLGLASRLRDARPVYARGVAMVARLIHDGTGPAFTPHAGVALRRAVAAAANALEGRWRDELATHYR